MLVRPGRWLLIVRLARKLLSYRGREVGKHREGPVVGDDCEAAISLLVVKDLDKGPVDEAIEIRMGALFVVSGETHLLRYAEDMLR